jgi:secretion/DNA translocation related TadE-like protein
MSDCHRGRCRHGTGKERSAGRATGAGRKAGAAKAAGSAREAGPAKEAGAGTEAGAMTVALAGVLSAALLVLCAGMSLGAAAVAAHRARAAADLGALAAAVVLQAGGGPGAACARGASVARLNGASARGCRAGADGTVVLTTSGPLGVRLPGVGRLEARGMARAGPGVPVSRGPSARGP